MSCSPSNSIQTTTDYRSCSAGDLPSSGNRLLYLFRLPADMYPQILQTVKRHIKGNKITDRKLSCPISQLLLTIYQFFIMNYSLLLFRASIFSPIRLNFCFQDKDTSITNEGIKGETQNRVVIEHCNIIDCSFWEANPSILNKTPHQRSWRSMQFYIYSTMVVQILY